MQLYLDSFGAYLSVRSGMFQVRTRAGGTHSFAVRQVGAVLLTRGTALSTDAALLAAEHDIPVLLIDAQTHFPLAQLSSGRPGSIAAVRREQAAFTRSAAGYAWVARAIAVKIGRQQALLQRLAEEADAAPGLAADVVLAGRVLTNLERKFVRWMPPDRPWDEPERQRTAERFRGQEGTASRLYFQQLGKYLAPRGWTFSARQQRPAYEPFNALLNYLYGMGYTTTHLALLKSGLDPYMGVLHADQWGARPTLAYDAIEPYRPWADEVALGLVRSGALTPGESFVPDADQRGLWLSPAGKSAAVEAMLAFLGEQAPYDRRRVRRAAQIELEAQKLATFLKENQV